MRPALTHLALHVSDWEATRDFYRDYCGMSVNHSRGSGEHTTLWLAEPGKEREFVIVVIAGGQRRAQAPSDYSHLGFALKGREEVDAIAARAEAEGVLAWPARDNPYPVGYYCALKDPEGTFVEFSYGQPLGPGAEDVDI